jgi:hypothetical protein
VYGDPAYGNGQARADYRDGGHGTFIKPGPVRPAVTGGFTIDDFAAAGSGSATSARPGTTPGCTIGAPG